MPVQIRDNLDSIIRPILSAGRISGEGIAVVAEGGTQFAKGYGYRDGEVHGDVPVGNTQRLKVSAAGLAV